MKILGRWEFAVSLHPIICLRDPSLHPFSGSTASAAIDWETQLYAVFWTVLKGALACIWRGLSTWCTSSDQSHWFDARQWFSHTSDIIQGKCLTLLAINVCVVCILLKFKLNLSKSTKIKKDARLWSYWAYQVSMLSQNQQFKYINVSHYRGMKVEFKQICLICTHFYSTKGFIFINTLTLLQLCFVLTPVQQVALKMFISLASLFKTGTNTHRVEMQAIFQVSHFSQLLWFEHMRKCVFEHLVKSWTIDLL